MVSTSVPFLLNFAMPVFPATAAFSSGDGSRFAFKGLYPFYSTKAGKWFFDICFENRKTFSYSPVNYYFAIPGGEVTKSEFIDQQPNR